MPFLPLKMSRLTDGRSSNRLLSRLTFVTTVGDFLSLFALMEIVHKVTDSIGLAAYLVGIKSLSVALGAMFYPRISRAMTPKQIIIFSQLVSALIAGVVVVAVHSEFANIYIIIVAAQILLSLLKQMFDIARETYSKVIGSATEHRDLQRELLSGLYSAQVVGPILSFFIIGQLGPNLPLAFDACSYLVAAMAACRLYSVGMKEQSVSVLAPLGI